MNFPEVPGRPVHQSRWPVCHYITAVGCESSLSSVIFARDTSGEVLPAVAGWASIYGSSLVNGLRSWYPIEGWSDTAQVWSDVSGNGNHATMTIGRANSGESGGYGAVFEGQVCRRLGKSVGWD
jgi:hypothetical protein